MTITLAQGESPGKLSLCKGVSLNLYYKEEHNAIKPYSTLSHTDNIAGIKVKLNVEM